MSTFNDQLLTGAAICLNVEIQVYGDRKIPPHINEYGCTHDLRTFCNGSDMELTIVFRVASKYK